MKRLLLLALSFLALGASRPLEVTFSPPRPTVGDPVTITFPAGVTQVQLSPGEGFEAIRGSGNQIVLRSFRPGPFEVSGRLLRGETASAFRMRLIINSVLQPNDSLEPAALKPPRPLDPNRAAFIAIAAAAAAALLSWLAAILLWRRRTLLPAPRRVPEAAEEFRIALGRAARVADGNARAIALAEATRAYLARIGGAYARELTTFELLQALPPGDAAAVIGEVLFEADLAKFSPWGASARDAREMVERLSRIPQQFEQQQKEAA
jgi:hypothetical protein